MKSGSMPLRMTSGISKIAINISNLTTPCIMGHSLLKAIVLQGIPFALAHHKIFNKIAFVWAVEHHILHF